jgi:hypothetical protein
MPPPLDIAFTEKPFMLILIFDFISYYKYYRVLKYASVFSR